MFGLVRHEINGQSAGIDPAIRPRGFDRLFGTPLLDNLGVQGPDART
ncbi:hypothetical protein [Sulfitobacter sp. MF3-043]